MKTIDEILDTSNCHEDLPSQAIIDALYAYEDEARSSVMELELELREANKWLKMLNQEVPQPS